MFRVFNALPNVLVSFFSASLLYEYNPDFSQYTIWPSKPEMNVSMKRTDQLDRKWKLKREADFVVIPSKARSQDRESCLSCDLIFSDQRNPCGSIPMYWLLRMLNPPKMNPEKCNLWGWSMKRMNRIKYGLRDKGTVPVSLRFPFHFHAGWDWEQTLHHGKQEEANSAVLYVFKPAPGCDVFLACNCSVFSKSISKFLNS